MYHRLRTKLLILLGALTILTPGVSLAMSTSTCFRYQLRSSRCSNEIQYKIPIDRYTCVDVKDMINCNAKAMTAKCSPWSLQEALHREMEMARAIFPGQNCSFLVEPTTKEEMGKFSNKICPARQELKINILHDICAGFLVAENPELIQMPCKAARDFVKHCVSKYLPRCVSKKTAAKEYRKLEAAQVANFLSNLATEAPDNKIRVRPTCSFLSKRKLITGKRTLIIRGLNMTEIFDTPFVEDPNQYYFTQSWKLLYDSIMDGSLDLPSSILEEVSKEEFIEILEEDRQSQMYSPHGPSPEDAFFHFTSPSAMQINS